MTRITNEAAYRWRKENPEKWRAITDRARAKRKVAGKKPSPQQAKKYHIKWKYGMTVEEFKMLFDKQGRACASCGETNPLEKNKWHVDHCHVTNRVCGILCHVCNTAAGVAGDDPARLRAIADYLEGSRA